jgi:hypothetical protein
MNDLMSCIDIIQAQFMEIDEKIIPLSSSNGFFEINDQIIQPAGIVLIDLKAKLLFLKMFIEDRKI